MASIVGNWNFKVVEASESHSPWRLVNAIQALIAGLLCTSQSLPAIAQDWSNFGGPNRNFQASTSIDPSVPLAPWSIELGLGDAAPLVIGDRVYVNELTHGEDGQEEVGIRCLSATSGETIWQVTTEERSYESQDISDSYPVRPIASLCYADGCIVSVSYGGIVACVNAADGSLLWKHDLVSEYEATPLQYGFASSPWCDREKVVVACGGTQALLKAFQLHDGSTLWSSEKGEAAFDSIAELPMPDGSSHLCYIGRDEMVGVNADNGQYLWRHPLPKPGLTNAVTPMVIAPGMFLAAGQGMEGSRLFRVQTSPQESAIQEPRLTIEETEHSARFTPFYCNCLIATRQKQVVTYNSGFLQGLAIDTGKVLWKQRNWTDTNCAMSGEILIGVRGDGYVATANLTEVGPKLLSGNRVINDRVWAPPVVIGPFALLRGRNSLVSFDWTKLPAISELPSGTSVDAMTAMYGSRPEPIVELLQKAKTDGKSFTYADYERIVNDRSLSMDDGDFRDVITSLVELNPALSLQIAEDWMKRRPDSIAAFDQWSASAIAARQDIPASVLEDRLVEVTVDVVVPTTTDSNADVYLTGNASACGAWKADGIKLLPADDGHYRASVRIPKGLFEFKITQGTWETVEVGLDGRGISNRRRKVTQPTTIQAVVQQWKGL